MKNNHDDNARGSPDADAKSVSVSSLGNAKNGKRNLDSGWEVWKAGLVAPGLGKVIIKNKEASVPQMKQTFYFQKPKTK